jgi:hypothetical protein
MAAAEEMDEEIYSPLPTASTRAANDAIFAQTSDNMLVFCRYQNTRELYAPIREWMTNTRWHAFTEIFCRANFADWDTLSNEQKLERANMSPYRVIMLDVTNIEGNNVTYKYVKTADGEPLFDDATLRTCEVDPNTGCAVGLPHNIQDALVKNALTNISVAENKEPRRIMIDLYPNRPIGSVHRFHKDSNDLMGPSENLEYVSLLFLPPDDVVTRGTLLSYGRLNDEVPQVRPPDFRETASLLCRAGTTVMFRDQSYVATNGKEIPSLIHATPQARPITATTTTMQGNFYRMSEANSVATPADFGTPYPRLFVRVHTSLHPRIGVTDVGLPPPITLDFTGTLDDTKQAVAITVNNDYDIMHSFRILDKEQYTAGKRTLSRTKKTKNYSKTRKRTSVAKTAHKNLKYYCKKENYTSFCKSLTGSSISFEYTK